MIYIGIDPGLDGAVAIIHATGSVEVFDTPTITVQGTKKKKRHYDMDAMLKIFSGFDAGMEQHIHCIIEEVHAMPGQGVTSMFSMGFGLGAWHMLLKIFRKPFMRVEPRKWKNEFGLISKDKNGSLLRAKELFPQADITLKKHDGRAEALLMAEYLRRTLARQESTVAPIPS